MKKIVKKEIDIIYKSNDITLHRINNTIHLFKDDDYTLNEVLDIIIYGLKTKIEDESFWNIKLSLADKQNVKPINLIYHLTGSDKIWKQNNWIWKLDWSEMSNTFSEHFDEKIIKLVKASKTLGELKQKIKNNLSGEDFYELGIMLDLINNDDTLL